MRALFLTFCFTLSALTVFCQQNIIKKGSEVTLQLSKDADDSYSYVIISNIPMNKTIELNNSFLKEGVDSNQIKIIFGKGKFGDGESTFLIIKNGLPKTLQYSAKIKPSGSDGFQPTSVGALIHNIKTVEMWQQDVEEIILSDFKKSSY